MMNYALTVKDNIITGVHHSQMLFGPYTFEANPRLASHQIVIVKEPGQYQRGMDIRCYEADGMLKDAVWCIQSGFMALPPGTEIIDGKLVDLEVPEQEAEPSVVEIILGLRNEIAGLKEAVAANTAKIASVELKPAEPIREVIK